MFTKNSRMAVLLLNVILGAPSLEGQRLLANSERPFAFPAGLVRQPTRWNQTLQAMRSIR